jgi:hypothetical protein
VCVYVEEEEEEELHQSSQMRLIRRNTNTRIEDPSTNLETVINASDDQKKVGLSNKSTHSPGPKRKQRRIVRPNRSKSRADQHKVELGKTCVWILVGADTDHCFCRRLGELNQGFGEMQ